MNIFQIRKLMVQCRSKVSLKDKYRSIFAYENFLNTKPFNTEYEIIFLHFFNKITSHNVKNFQELVDLDVSDAYNELTMSGTEQSFLRNTALISFKSFLGVQRGSKYGYKIRSKQIDAFLNPHHAISPLDMHSDLEELKAYLALHRSQHHTRFSDIIRNAKRSSSSSFMRGHSIFDYAMTHDLNTIRKHADDLINLNLCYYVYGDRGDKRGKHRYINSVIGPIRIIDALVCSDIDQLTHGTGPLAPITVEGYNLEKLYATFAQFSQGIGCSTDFTGYESQIGIKNMIIPLIKELAESSEDKDRLIKFLSFCGPVIHEEDVIIPSQTSLASGLRGTHTFENIIQYLSIQKAINADSNITLDRLKINGDDHLSIHNTRNSAYRLINQLLKQEFKVDELKSLIGAHKMLNRYHFNDLWHPTQEPGTFVSTMVQSEYTVEAYKDLESSRFAAMYGAAVRLVIYHLRMGLPLHDVLEYIDSVGINVDGIPINLEELTVKSSTHYTPKLKPYGMISVKDDLNSLTGIAQLFGLTSDYELLSKEWSYNLSFTLEPTVRKYVPSFTIEAYTDFTDISPSIELPYVLQRLSRFTSMHANDSHSITRLILQNCRSLTLPVPKSYTVTGIVSLSKAINDRERYLWRMLCSNII